MDDQKKEPKLTEEQDNLIKSYQKFSFHAYANLYDLKNPNTDEILELTEFLGTNRNIIEAPLWDTCKDYYNDGCSSTRIEFLTNFILSALFGAFVGITLSYFLNVPFFWIYALIFAIICLGIAIFYKAYKKKV